jgi:cysteinyl-tRNA synthetase
VRELAAARERARAERDFAEADRLREEIAARGWEVRDVAGGFQLLPL